MTSHISSVFFFSVKVNANNFEWYVKILQVLAEVMKEESNMVLLMVQTVYSKYIPI